MNRIPSPQPSLSEASVPDRWIAQGAALESVGINREGARNQQVIELTARVAELTRQNEERELKIQKLTFELARLKRIRFGAKAEAFNAAQRDLFSESCDEDLAAIAAELEPASPNAAKSSRSGKHPGRNPLPPELPRIEHRHEPESCTCGQCGRDLVKIGEDISEQLDVEPAQFFVHRHIRPQYACRACETVTAAPVPPAVIDGGLAAPGLYAWVLIQKYQDCPCRCIDWKKSPPATGSRSHVPLWPGGSVRWGCSFSRSPIDWRRNSAKARSCMPMKPRSSNSTPVKGKPNEPIYGPTAAMTWKTVTESSSSITAQAAAATMPANSCAIGTAS